LRPREVDPTAARAAGVCERGSSAPASSRFFRTATFDAGAAIARKRSRLLIRSPTAALPSNGRDSTNTAQPDPQSPALLHNLRCWRLPQVSLAAGDFTVQSNRRFPTMTNSALVAAPCLPRNGLAQNTEGRFRIYLRDLGSIGKAADRSRRADGWKREFSRFPTYCLGRVFTDFVVRRGGED